MAVIGEGNINFDRVFYSAEKAGTEFMLVEQDDCNRENPFDCLRRSYEFLKSRGFE
jgi:sugar phosphate isomerase/epimerase